MKTLEQWLSEYGLSHQNPQNRVIHKICVPLIFFSLLGMMWDWEFAGVRLTYIVVLAGLLFYVRLGIKALVVILAQLFVYLGVLQLWSLQTGSVFVGCLVIFVLAWVGQFIGHKIEGKKPSFFQDLQFLLIGPLWVFSFLFNK